MRACMVLLFVWSATTHTPVHGVYRILFIHTSAAWGSFRSLVCLWWSGKAFAGQHIKGFWSDASLLPGSLAVYATSNIGKNTELCRQCLAACAAHHVYSHACTGYSKTTLQFPILGNAVYIAGLCWFFFSRTRSITEYKGFMSESMAKNLLLIFTSSTYSIT